MQQRPCGGSFNRRMYKTNHTNLNIPSNIAELLSEDQTINLIDFLNKTNIISKL